MLTETALSIKHGGRECRLARWLRVAARERLEARQRVKLFESPDDVKEFFRSCAVLDGPETEPDWDEHLRVMNESRGTGVTGT